MAVLVPLFVLGCAANRPERVHGEAPPRMASAEELAAQLNRNGAQIKAVKGKLEMGLMEKPGQPVKRCRGVLLSRNGWHGTDSPGLYLKGYKRLTPTFFTLVTDGREFWFHIPRDNVVFTGPLEFSGNRYGEHEIHLDAGDLLKALFVRPVNKDDRLELEEDGQAYTVSVYGDGHLERKLWIERELFTVEREIYYGPDGAPRLEIEKMAYVEVDGHLYPEKVVLRDAASGSSVFLEFDSMKINPEAVRDKIFHFDIPAGVGVERIAQRDRRL